MENTGATGGAGRAEPVRAERHRPLCAYCAQAAPSAKRAPIASFDEEEILFTMRQHKPFQRRVPLSVMIELLTLLWESNEEA